MNMEMLNNISTIASAIIAFLAFPYAIWQLSLSRKSSSAELVVALNDSLRSSWWDYVHSENEEMKKYHMDDILSILELVSALRADKLFYRGSGTFISDLLEEHILLIRKLSQEDPSVFVQAQRLKCFGKLVSKSDWR